jgi:uncharacterized RDD family membrane protein YckC
MQIYIFKEGQQFGPYSLELVNACIANGTFQLSDRAWYQGAADWAPLATVPGIVAALPPHPDARNSSLKSTLRLATPGSRLWAMTLDSLIGVGCVLPGAIVFIAGYSDKQMMIAGACVVLLAVLILAIVQLYMLTLRGQTIGKRVMGIKIVNLNDEALPGFFKIQVLRGLVPGLLAAVPYIGCLFWIVDSCFIFRDDRRCIHDLIAGTKVVVA